MDRIRRIEASLNPLSADVVIINGENCTWIYDVGCCDEAYEAIRDLPNKNIVISHFHPDHMANLSRLEFAQLYVGKNTFKYTKQGTIVENAISYNEDDIKIIPIPSSHAKGCLALQLSNQCLLVGDALYPQHKGSQRVYNVQHLKSQIELIKSLDVKWIGFSHQADFFQEKENVLKQLQDIYERREANEAFITA